MQKKLNQAEMAESGGIQAIFNQVATAVMRVLTDTDVGP